MDGRSAQRASQSANSRDMAEDGEEPKNVRDLGALLARQIGEKPPIMHKQACARGGAQPSATNHTNSCQMNLQLRESE